MLPLLRTWRQRALVLALARRELVARYRGGVLGFLWSLVNPLLLLAVYATVFRYVFTPRADVRPYALFLFGGVLVWGFVSAALIDASETFRANGPLLRKTTVAPEVFPGVAVAARLAHLLLALPVLLAAIAWAAFRGSVAPGLALLQFPLVVLLLAASVHGLALADLGARRAFRGRARSRRQPPHADVLPDAHPLPGRGRSRALPRPAAPQPLRRVLLRRSTTASSFSAPSRGRSGLRWRAPPSCCWPRALSSSSACATRSRRRREPGTGRTGPTCCAGGSRHEAVSALWKEEDCRDVEVRPAVGHGDWSAGAG